MTTSKEARERADARFGKMNRSADLSASGVIAAEREATGQKTARLRALRLAKEAADRAEAEAAPPAPRKRARKAPARTA